VVAEPRGAAARGKRLQLAQVLEVERIRAADRERHAVHHDRVALGDAVEHLHRTPTRVHEVLGHDLEPVDRRPVLEHVSEVLRAQAEPEPEVGQTEAVPVGVHPVGVYEESGGRDPSGRDHGRIVDRSSA
jgi:hypothetical protein